MKITTKEKEIRFDSMPFGAVFVYNKDLWIRVLSKDEYRNAVNICTGDVSYFSSDCKFALYEIDEVILSPYKGCK